jgi:hypothetical protein
MPRGEIHPPGLIDHRRLKRFGKLDEQIDARLRPRVTVHHDQRILGLNQ